jgi:2-oxo-4-hydroxy-4-carboxy-5-ureidoimidazoline decarboxylase
MSKAKLSIDRINSLDRQAFVEAFGSLFEGSPWIASEAWPERPFGSVTELHEKLCGVMFGATREQQLALIRAHPDLVGRATLAGTLTRESTGEQAAAGLNRLSPEEIAEFSRLNAAYKDRFGFPFVICARENKKESILSGFDMRLHNTQDEEIGIALGEIARIAHLRLLDAASDES